MWQNESGFGGKVDPPEKGQIGMNMSKQRWQMGQGHRVSWWRMLAGWIVLAVTAQAELVVHWTFDGGEGTDMAPAAPALAASLHYTTYLPTGGFQESGALNFDGSSYLSATKYTLGAGNWTVSFWVQTSDNGNYTGYPGTPQVPVLGANGGDIAFGLGINDGKPFLAEWDTPGFVVALGNTSVADGEGHVLTYVHHSDLTYDIYVDGVLDRGGIAGHSGRCTYFYDVGRSYSLRYAHMVLDDVRIYNEALTAGEIAILFGELGFEISGRITNSVTGAGVDGVTLEFGDDYTAVTTNGGYYSIYVPEEWSGTVTPDAAWGTYEPASRTYSEVSEDMSGQDYGVTLASILASGGEVSVIMDSEILYRVHTFLTNGTFEVMTGRGTVEYLVVAGGGGGGGVIGGGGGAGGLLSGVLDLGVRSYEIQVGAGGLGGMGYNNAGQAGSAGQNSCFGNRVAFGGGGGAGWSGHPGSAGGSGGGGSAGGSGTAATQTNGYGNAGGSGDGSNFGGGGGGASQAGAGSGSARKGGDGYVSGITGVQITYAGGGGGGTRSGYGDGGAGGAGGGGAGTSTSITAGDGMPHTGGGGGGAGYNGSSTARLGGTGGSGIVIVRYPLGTCYTISGRITNSATGAGVDGVTLAFGEDNTAVTTNGGYYSVYVPEGWSGTAVPDEAWGTYEPASRTYSEVAENAENQDYGLSSVSFLATGGEISETTVGGITYRIHTFTNIGEQAFDVLAGSNEVDVLVVGGGGGGGETIGGGGGGGGVVYSNGFSLSLGKYDVVVGAGGTGGWGSVYPPGTKGANSVFGTLTAIGGGAGAGFNESASGTGGSAGGNGGGGGARAGYTPGQGHDGGGHWGSNAGGGGGGAGASGSAGTSLSGGKGGDGRALDISGEMSYYGGGGGGGTRNSSGPNAGAGGLGGGGAGGRTTAGGNGISNTGGGGGGGGYVADLAGGNGGSGIVIVRYPLGTCYTISGRITNSATGAGVDGVTLAFGEDNTAVTTNGGYYSVYVPEGWSGTAVPDAAWGTYHPASRTYSDVAEDLDGQDYGLTPVPFIAAGGDVMEITVSGALYRVHTFLSNGTFDVLSGSAQVEYLVVAGGGGGGLPYGGGGGAGGYLEGILPVGTGVYQVIVGAGGAGRLQSDFMQYGEDGGNSVLGEIIAIGGGGGGAYDGTGHSGRSGGSGGGGGVDNNTVNGGAGGTGISGQGYNGAQGGRYYIYGGGGGGGAGSAGYKSSSSNVSGAGGNAQVSTITGTAVARAGGGAGGMGNTSGSFSSGAVQGGAGQGGYSINGLLVQHGQDGQPNTGSGGGGGGGVGTGFTGTGNSGAGGSGIVIVRYPFISHEYAISGRITNSVTGSGVDGVTLVFGDDYTTVTTNGGYYSVSMPEGWSGTAVPDEAWGTYEPASRTYSEVAEDVEGQDYAFTPPPFSATGGTISGIDVAGILYRVHTFLSNGTFEVLSGEGEMEYLVVGGGGSGGAFLGAGGGGGGVVEGTLTLTNGLYPITVGTGGAGVTYSVGNNGGDSSFATVTAFGGGGGGRHDGSDRAYVGLPGGCGGGSSPGNASRYAGALATQTDPEGGIGYGNAGGDSSVGNSPLYCGGGGGGAGGAGLTPSTIELRAGHGGGGHMSAINGTELYWAGGGGGSMYATGQGDGDGGLGGGGGGAGYSSPLYGSGGGTALNAGADGTADGGGCGGENTGGGGGAAGSSSMISGTGGSGIVIVRYPIGSLLEISGRITNSLTGNGVSGVVVKTADGELSATTEADGTYVINGMEGEWSGRLTPVHPFGAGEFTPEWRDYENVNEVMEAQDYGWLPPDPEVDAVSPAWGRLAGGEEIEIYGRYFSNPGVYFGEVPAASVTVVSHELLRVTAPASEIGGKVDIRVVNDDGLEALMRNGYEYQYSGIPVQWEANEHPSDSGLFTVSDGTVWTADDPESGFVRYEDINVGTPSISLISAGTSLVRSNGWRVETRINCITNYGSSRWGFSLIANDNVSGCYLDFYADHVNYYNDAMTQGVVPITEGEYHVYELTMAPGGTSITFRVDGIMIADLSANVATPGYYTSASRVMLGSYGSAQNGEAIIDYLHINTLPPWGFHIEGQITNRLSGAGVPGIVLHSTDGLYSATTDVNGAYCVIVDEEGWSGQITPTHVFGTGPFAPEYREYQEVVENHQDQDYGWLPPDPEVDEVSPTWGGLAGGEEIEIHGRYFSNPGVFFGEVPAVSVTVVSYELLRVTVPEAAMGGAVDVWVINEDGTDVTVTNGYEYRPVISGRVTQALTDIGIEGMRVVVTGQDEVTLTDTNGEYGVAVSAPWDGMVSVFDPEGIRNFEPTEWALYDVREDLSGLDFTWTPPTSTVRGRVYNAGTLEGMEGVGVTFSPGGTAVTTNGGYYEMTLEYGWSGSFAPQTAEGQFTPAVRMLSGLALDQEHEDFGWGPTPTPGTKYVSLTGNNTFPYMSYETAAHEIQAAVNACEPGDEVVVLDGTYDLTSGVLVDKPVTIRSMNGAAWTTVRRGSGNAGVFYLLTNAVLDGFTITGGSLSNSLPQGAKAAGVTADWGAEVRNCIIFSNRTERVSGAGGLSLDNGALAVNCAIFGNELAGGQGGGGVLLDRGAELINTTVYGNRACSVQEWQTVTVTNTVYRWVPQYHWTGYSYEYSHSVYDAVSVVQTVQQLVFVNRPGVGGVYQSTNGTVQVDNSIIWGNVYGYGGSNQTSVSANLFSQEATNGAQMIVRYSCYENATGVQEPVASFSVDPLFRDLESGDLRLQEASWCINAGNDAYAATALDLAGQLRQSGTVDMGAYEFQGGRPRILGRVTHIDTGAGMDGVTLAFTGTNDAATAGGGYYSQVVAPGWSGDVTPSFTNGTFDPASKSYTNVTADLRGEDHEWTPPDPVVSGQITHEMTGLGVDGVVIDFGAAGSVVSSNGGYYAISLPRFYEGATAASHPEGGGFTPASRSYADLRVNVTTQHYVWNPPLRPISGRVTHHYTSEGVSGVALIFGAGGPAGVVSDVNGIYTGLVYYGWSGRVTLSKSGGAFSPVAYRDYDNISGGVADQDYAWVPVDPTISGRVTNTQTGAGVSGVTLTTEPGGLSVQTGSSGTYSRQVPWGWEGTLIPAYALGSFEPSALIFDAVTANRTNQNLGWIPTPRTVSGRVSHLDTGTGLNGVELTFSDGYSTTTAGDGEYSRVLYHGWSGGVFPASVAGGWISPSNRSFTLNADLPGQDFVWHPDRTISGTVRHEDTSNGVPGVTVSCSSGASLTTDESGSYSFVVAHGWSGMMTVAYSSGSFAPVSRSYTAVAADQTGQDFTWKPPRMVSGRVVHEDDPAEGIAGVTVTFAPGNSVTTDTEGYYSNTVAQGWSGTLMASFATGSFDPVSRSVSTVTIDVDSQDFTWKPPRVVSGRVVHEDDPAEGIAGVTVTFSSGGSVTTDAEGYYSNEVAQGWSGMLTASLATGSFDPASRSVNDVTVDVPDQDFTWKPPRVVSGRVVHQDTLAGVAGVAIVFTPGDSVTTDAEGYYSNTVAQGWSGILMPAYSNGGFAPTNRSLVDVQEHTTDQDFTWLPPRSISGRVYNEDDPSEGISGATVFFIPGGSETTDEAGDYSRQVPQGWTGMVSVSYSTGTFDPASRSYSIGVVVDIPDEDYAWQSPRTIAGRVVNACTTQGVANIRLAAWGGKEAFTDSQGYYSLTQNQGWSGQITPDGAPGSFEPGYRAYETISVSATNEDYEYIPLNPIIAGQVTNFHTGAAVSNTAILFISAGETSAIAVAWTDGQGGYTQEVAYGWSGSVMPSNAIGLFSPDVQTFSNVVETTGGVSFAWVPPMQSISGVATNMETGEGVAGVRLAVTGFGQVSSGTDGSYSLQVYYGWTGTVTATTDAGSIATPWREYEAVTNDLAGQNYGVWPLRVLSGRVVDSATGRGMDGAWVRLSSGGSSNLTAGGGYYMLVATQGWSGTVSVLTLTGSFSPAVYAITNLSGDQADLDFSWNSRFTISGRVLNHYTGAGEGGVIVVFSGAGAVTSGVNGAYSMQVPYGWSGTATPEASSGTFAAPVSRTYAEVWEDLDNQHFYWVPPDPELRGRVTNKQTGEGMAGVAVQVEGLAEPVLTVTGGGYTQRVNYGWSGNVTPSSEEGSFSPETRTCANVTNVRTGLDFQWTPPGKMIMGVVTNADTGGGVSGVRISFSGGIGTATTGVDGAYAMMVWAGWSGTATASRTNGSFVSSTRTFGSIIGDLTDCNYAWWPPRTISGRVGDTNGVGVASVTVKLPGSQGVAVTSSNGIYALSVTQGWSGRVTATNALGGLVPAYRDYAAVTGDRPAQDYVWHPNPTISGRVVNQATGAGVFGVSVNFGGLGSVTSDSTGAYALTVPYGWSGAAAASYNRGSFAAPTSRAYSNVIANVDGEDYVWIPADPVVSGRVTNQVTGIGVGGVTVAFSGLGDVTTAANGAYSRTVPLGWSGTITASVETGVIQPGTLEIPVCYENLTGQNFSWVAPDPWITGRVVCQITGRGVSGIQLNFTGVAEAGVTDEHGEYAVQVPYNWSGSAVPESDGATYAPVQRTYSQVRSAMEQQDYTWIPDPVAGDRYVSKTGSSTYPFTSWDTAATNVHWAVDTAQAGDTVWVGEGTYDLSAALEIDRPLWVRGAEGAASTELRRTGAEEYRLVRMTHSGAKMDGFTLSNGKIDGGAGVRIDAGYLYNCIVRDHDGAGVLLGPMAVARMANCLVTGNSGDGIAGSGAVINCTVVENEGGSIEADAVYNSIVDGVIDSPEIRFTLSPEGYAGLGNQSGSATFVNAAGGNYRLADGSTGLDAGRNEYNTLSTDVGGMPRIFNIIDLGAYEKVSQGGLAVSLMSDPSPLPVGDALRFTLYVVNQGPNGAQGVEVVCPLDSGVNSRSNNAAGAFENGIWSVGELPAGQMRQMHVWCTAESAGYATNVAVVSASQSDPIQPGYGVSTNITRVLGEVGITNVAALVETESAVVEWDSAVGMTYNVYVHDGPLVDEPDWALRANMVASEEARHYVDSLGGAQGPDRRYYQVTYPGRVPSPSNVWAVIRLDVRPAGHTLVSPPVQTDRRFDGDLGAVLAEALDGHDDGIGAGADEVHLLQADGSWRKLYLDASKTWREEDDEISTYELPEGAGLWVVHHAAGDCRITFTGPVGNTGTKSVPLRPGLNLIGPSEGRDLPLAATLASADPIAGPSQETSDQLIFQKADGSWRFLMKVSGWGPPYEGNWFDVGAGAVIPENETLPPGKAFYYLRRGEASDVEF